MGELLGDADYMASVLATLPGVDPNDPALQETLRSLQQVCLRACSLLPTVVITTPLHPSDPALQDHPRSLQQVRRPS